MNRAERKAVVALVLAGYAGGAVVAAATLQPLAGPLRVALAPGVAYLAALRALSDFAAIAAVGPAAMNALYAVCGYALWWVGAYLVGVRVLGAPRGQLKAVALSFPGVVGVAVSLALVVGGLAGAAGAFGNGRSRTAWLVLAVAGGVLWVPALGWISRVRSRAFGWQTRTLEHGDVGLEMAGYAVLLAGLALVAVGVTLDVGAQYLVVAVLAVAVLGVTALVPTGGEPRSTGFG